MLRNIQEEQIATSPSFSHKRPQSFQEESDTPKDKDDILEVECDQSILTHEAQGCQLLHPTQEGKSKLKSTLFRDHMDKYKNADVTFYSQCRHFS